MQVDRMQTADHPLGYFARPDPAPMHDARRTLTRAGGTACAARHRVLRPLLHAQGDQTMATQLRPFAIVTGASSGIGFELAKCCTANGFDILIAGEQPQVE